MTAMFFTTEENEDTEKGGENLGLGERRDCYNGDGFNAEVAENAEKDWDLG